jgi:small-conductance mechanosensitive channel
MLEEAARRTEGVSASPSPYVRQTALADFYAEYRLVAQTPVEDPERRTEVLSRLHGNIQDVFNEHGVPIMSPHYMTDSKDPQIVPKERWYAPPAKAPEPKKGD